MKAINSDYLRRVINEAVSEMMGEATPPTPIKGGAPRPIKGGAPMPIKGGAPKPIGGGPAPIGKPAGPAPVGGNAAQSLNPNNPPVITPTPTADLGLFNGGPTKNGFRPGIIEAKYENFYETQDPNMQDKEVLKIYMDYVHNIHAQRYVDALNKQFPDVLHATKVSKNNVPKDVAKNFMYAIKLIALPDQTDEFIQKIPDIVDLLYQFKTVNKMTKVSFVYDETFRDEFKQKFADIAEKTPNEKDIEEANMRIADTWMDLLSTLKDPATLNKLNSINGAIYPMASAAASRNTQAPDTFGDNGFESGHALSFRNRMQVFAQDPNATFVTQKFAWEKYYNHEVIDPTRFILVTIPSHKKVDLSDRDKGAQKAGYAGGYDEFKTRKKRGELQGGELHAVRMNAQKASNDDVFFTTVKMYDVANTRPIPGMQSKFLPGAGQLRDLENNVMGIPNAAARKAGVAPVAAAPIPQTTSNGSNDQVQLIKDSLVAIVKKEVQSSTPAETGNAERDIVNYAYAYAKFLLATAFQGISKPETQEAFCQGFVAGVAVAVGIEDPQAANYLQSALANRGKDSTIKQLIVQWFNEYVDLMDAVRIDVQKKLIRMAKPKAGQKVVEEMDEEGLGTTNVNIKPLSLGQFEELFGITDDGLYEEQDDEIEDMQLQESFFRFLDSMEGYGNA